MFIQDDRTIIIGIIIIFISIRRLRISHFPMNPNRGGKPPIDRMLIVKALIMNIENDNFLI